MLKRVISGFQTGADIAAVRAAWKCGIVTGGYMPFGYRTELGPRPTYVRYGAMQHTSKDYPPRTRKNVYEATATLRFASKWGSPGELCTARAIDDYKKPYLDVDINELPEPSAIVDWIRDNEVVVLNVAGNTESTSPGIETIVEDFLSKVFKLLVL